MVPAAFPSSPALLLGGLAEIKQSSRATLLSLLDSTKGPHADRCAWEPGSGGQILRNAALQGRLLRSNIKPLITVTISEGFPHLILLIALVSFMFWAVS